MKFIKNAALFAVAMLIGSVSMDVSAQRNRNSPRADMAATLNAQCNGNVPAFDTPAQNDYAAQDNPGFATFVDGVWYVDNVATNYTQRAAVAVSPWVARVASLGVLCAAGYGVYASGVIGWVGKNTGKALSGIPTLATNYLQPVASTVASAVGKSLTYAGEAAIAHPSIAGCATVTAAALIALDTFVSDESYIRRTASWLKSWFVCNHAQSHVAHAQPRVSRFV